MALSLDGSKTALVLIDLQHGILAMPMQPHPVKEVLTNSQALLDGFGKRNAPVIFVRVDLAAMNRLTTDAPQGDASAPPPPPQASEIVPEAGVRPH